MTSTRKRHRRSSSAAAKPILKAPPFVYPVRVFSDILLQLVVNPELWPTPFGQCDEKGLGFYLVTSYRLIYQCDS